MSTLRAWFARLGGLFGKKRRDLELDAEMASHLQMHIDDNLRSGMTPEQGRRRALLMLGGMDQTKERYRDRRGIPWVESLLQDLRFGLRMLGASPGFTAVAVLTLALGIGANAAIFSLTDQVLLKDLPVANAKQLVILRVPGYREGHVHSDSDDATSFSYPMYRDLRDHAPVFSGLIARFGVALSVAGRGESQPAVGELVSGNYFDVLGVTPALGRVFSQGDDTAPGGNPVAVLSYGYWSRRFGNDPDVLNKALTVNGVALTVVGVARADFRGVQIGRSTDIFIPMSMKALMTPGWDGLAAPNDAWLAIIGRLKPEFSGARADLALAPTVRAIEEAELPALGLSQGSRQATEYLSRPVELLSGEHGRPILQSNLKTPLLVLVTLVGVILLVACANLASLLLARGEARQHEMAVRLALGAPRWRLVKQLLTESFLLALAGGLAGVLLSWWTLRVLISAMEQGVGVSGLDMRIDPRVLMFTATVSILTAILFGLGPALRTTDTSLPKKLKDQGQAASGGGSNVRLRKWLMATQVALTATLLVSAGYFLKSLVNLRHQDAGVRLDHVVQFSVNPSLDGYTLPRTIALFKSIREQVRALPGVRSVSVAKNPIFEYDDWASNISVEGYSAKPSEEIDVFRNSVAPDYFSAMGIPLLAGRDFRDSDSAAGPKVVVINEKMASKYFAGRSPLGEHIAWGAGTNVHPDVEIVGVVRNSKHEDLRDTIHPFLYQPYTQDSKLGAGTFYVRTSQDPATLTGTLVEVVERLDPNLPVFHVMTLEQEADHSVFPDRALSALSVCLGLLAALLAAVGLYGVLAYIVTRRTKEVGIRLALGATRKNVAWLILGEVMGMAAVGLAIGLAAAFGLGSLIQAHLYGVKAADPSVFLATATLLAAIVVVAGWLPAQKAANLDPMAALRHE